MRSDSDTPHRALPHVLQYYVYVYFYYQAAMAALSKYLLFDLINCTVRIVSVKH